VQYIHADISSGDYRAVPSHVDIPVIDPLLGHEFVSLSGQYAGEQTTAATASTALNAKLLAHRSVTQFWTRDSTPPSSVDLEWEHEGTKSQAKGPSVGRPSRSAPPAAH
jgi:hypothetical protein